MYNRYIPQPDGSFCRRQMQDSRPTHTPDCNSTPQEQPMDAPCQKETPASTLPVSNCRRKCPNCHKKTCSEQSAQHPDGNSLLSQILPKDFDTGDLMVILLLLLMAGDCPENQSNALLTLALYLFL